MRAGRNSCGVRTLGNQLGLTMMEVIVAAIVTGFVLLALITLYLTSMDAWDRSGVRLAMQRSADLALERIASDIRMGSKVEIGAGQDEMDIYRTTATGDSLVASYGLVGSELRNNHGTVLADHVTSLQFVASGGTKVTMQLTMEDDLGTTSLDGDDVRLYSESAIVCRNRVFY
jgi:hypothetical protein